MYRTPTHEPRYKQGPYERETKGDSRRYEDAKESSECSSSEEEEESTDRYTEESEATTESPNDRRECEWSSASNGFDRKQMYSKFPRPEDLLLRAYYANEQPQKHDKITQKNFLSPFPSFLIPPTYSNTQRAPNYGFTATKNPREYDAPKSSKNTAKKSGKCEGDNACEYCPPCDRKTRKQLERRRAEEEMRYFSPVRYKPERILTCLQEDATTNPPSSLLLRNKPKEGSFGKNPAKVKLEKVPSKDSKAKQVLSSCKGCFQMPESRKKVKPKVEGIGKKSETVEEDASVKKGQDGRPVGAKKVREKLVYVVEEDGKGATKMETDLFSLNEILRIKKDLVELGEFAKKLKKMKELKKEAEKGNVNKSPCQCKPVAELLQNVNKRIEALEAKQEELEKGCFKPPCKGDTETDSKKVSQVKMAPNSPPKMPVMVNKSAITTVPSVPKTEMIVSRERLSNNSEIVNELMDLKTQLQKLEKRRMSKEMTAEPGPSGEKKQLNKKVDRPIAVFSSRTYILTSDNFEKKKTQTAEKENVSKDFNAAVEIQSKIDQTKENVANWLKSVSANGDRSEFEPNLVQDSEGVGGHAIQCQTMGPQFSVNPEIQEPQKNRASESSPKKQRGMSVEVLMKNEKMVKPYAVEQAIRIPCKECIMTPSGKVYVDMISEDVAKNSSGEKKPPSRSLSPRKPYTPGKPLSPSKPLSPTFFKGSKKFASRTISTCSVPSAIRTKEHTKPPMMQLPSQILESQTRLPGNQSQSTQELTTSSNGAGEEQASVRYLSPKNLGSSLPPSKDKTHKESRNERMKKLESQFAALKKSFVKGDDPQNYSSYSELIRTIDFDDTEKAGNSREEEERNEMRVYSMPKIQKMHFRGLESKPKPVPCLNPYPKRSTSRRDAEEAAARERMRREAAEEEARKERMRIEAEEQAKREKMVREAQEAAEREKKRCEAKQLACKKEITEKSCPKPPVVQPEVPKIEKVENEGWCTCKRCCGGKESEEDKTSTNSTFTSEETTDTESSTGSRRRRRRRKRRKKSSDEDSDESSGRRGRRKKKKGKKKKKKKKKIHCKNEPEPRIIRIKNKIRKTYEPRLKDTCELELLLKKLQVDTSPPESACRLTVNRPDICIRGRDPRVMPTLTQQKSEDSFVYYLNRANMKRESGKEKLIDDGCALKNLFKGLRRLYPNFSGFQFSNFPGNIVEKTSSQQPPKIAESQKYYEENDSDGYAKKQHRRTSKHPTKISQHRSSKQPKKTSRQHSTQGQSPSHQYHASTSVNRPEGAEHVKNCRCIQVFTQRQGCQEWPGVAPFKNPSDLTNESETEVSSAGSKESLKILKDDFIFPGRPFSSTQVQCVCRASRCCGHRGRRCGSRRVKVKHRCHRSKKHRKRKKGSKRCSKRRSKKCTRRRAKKCAKKWSKKCENCCRCDRCGNIHEKVYHGCCERAEQESYRHDPACQQTPECRSGSEPVSQESFGSQCNPSCATESPTFFAFFKNYFKSKLKCKNSSRACSSKGSLRQKMSDVRHLKTCSSGCKRKRKSKAKRRRSDCACGIEERSNCSESYSQSSCHSQEQYDRNCHCAHKSKRKKRKRKSRKKSKRRSKKHCCHVYSVFGAWPGTEGEKRRSKHENCDCPDCTSKDEDKVIRTYYMHSGSDKDRNVIAGTESNETSETKTTSTPKADTTTGTTSEEKSTECSKCEVDSQHKAETDLKGRLSSIQSLLKYFQRQKKPRREDVVGNTRRECDVKEKKKESQEAKGDSSSLIRKFLGQKREKTVKNKNEDKRGQKKRKTN